nr:ADP-ribosylation factor GTPase-activating protein AGD10 [Tanacetum cinerariifolium]
MLSAKLKLRFDQFWIFIPARLTFVLWIWNSKQKRSTKLDSWTSDQLKMMASRGNNHAHVFFKQHGWTNGGKTRGNSRAQVFFTMSLMMGNEYMPLLPAFANMNTHLLPRKSVAKKLPELSGKGVTTIIRGGDSASAVEEARVADVMSDISTSSGTKIYPLSLYVKDNGNHHLTHFSQPEFDQVEENARNHHRAHFRQRQSPPDQLLSAT